MAGWKSQVRQYGVVKAKTIPTARRDLTPPEETAIDAHRTKEQADVCLSCTKSTCSGNPNCFRKRRKELACATSAKSSET